VLIIALGDTDSSLSEQACAQYPQAQLLTSESELVDEGVYYTSLGDFGSESALVRVLNRADQLHYMPPRYWTDQINGHSAMQAWTEFYLLYYHGRKPVLGIEHLLLRPNLPATPDRVSSQPQLWAVGSTITLALDLEPAYTWAGLLASRLELPVSIAAKTEATVEWSADQILRMPLQSGDVIVWELAKVDNIVQAMTMIYQAQNFARCVGARIYFVGLQNNDLIKYMAHIPEYYHLYGHLGIFFAAYMDKDWTTLWPGAGTHAWYADEIYKKFFL